MRYLDHAMLRIVRGLVGDLPSAFEADCLRVQLDEPHHFAERGVSDYPCVLVVRIEAERESSRGSAEERIDFAKERIDFATVTYMVSAVGQDLDHLEALRRAEEVIADRFQAVRSRPSWESLGLTQSEWDRVSDAEVPGRSHDDDDGWECAGYPVADYPPEFAPPHMMASRDCAEAELPADERTWYVLWGDVDSRVQADDSEDGKRYWTRGVVVKLDCQGRT